ncbi:response regulator [Streptomyces sp. WAC 06738]|uniref:response regulator n=1 Tax=Streptomyces sp. WAC 06738 TaxID=2203210 RepID=UPI000F6CC965|nr:response regulator [Streptomyces sp. WAC 06738]AZM49735.1 response regulator [Streptomyces sp. WAC 06738]
MTTAAAPPTPPPAPDPASILIVDDMEENLVALAAVLGPLGQRVVFAHSGEEALKAMLRQQFAVVLLDILMPGMDGFETAANIKRLDQTKDVPIILLTGQGIDPDYAYRGYAVGAADFLAKPIEPWILRTKVNVFLELHRKNRQLAVQAEQLQRLLLAEQSGDAGFGERLGDVTWRLVQIESLLRERAGPTGPALADQVKSLETSVRNLTRHGGRGTREGAAQDPGGQPPGATPPPAPESARDPAAGDDGTARQDRR